MSVALAAAVTGMSAITAIAALLGTLGPMMAAQTFLLSLQTRPGRSLFRAEFDVWWDNAKPNRYQRWYLPVIGAVAAGSVAELLRALVFFGRAHAPISRQVVVAATRVGALEGLLVALVFALGFGLSWYL